MINENIDNIIKMNEKVYVLGRLATGRDYYNGMAYRQDCVSMSKFNENMILFFVEALSDETEYCKNIFNRELNQETRELYIGVDTQQIEAIYPFGYIESKKINYKYLSSIEKEELIYEYLKDKLLIFKVYLDKIKPDNSGFKNLILEHVLDIKYDGQSEYKTIPEVQEKTMKFEENLVSGKTIRMEGYTHDLLLPEAIICGEYIYTDFSSGDWEKVEGTIDEWRFINKSEKIRKLQLDVKESEYDTKIIRKLGSIVFIEKDYFYDNTCSSDKLSYQIKNLNGNKTTKNESENIILEESDKCNEKLTDIITKENRNDLSEIKFLNKLKHYTMKKNLYYDMKDIINLHVSIKTNYMTIVAGMSGTGKTQISLAYAKALGASEEDGTLLFLPITPSYTEPEDLTGYLNTTTGLYICSETGLVDFLIHAQQNKDKLHFVVFDEMNLSQVEHWFAPFISLLELNEKDRNLKLYSKKCVCHNGSRYSHTVNIGDNIRFIGTVNLDETTKDFSDRLLDRANLVSLRKGSLKDFKREKQVYEKSIEERIEFTFAEYLTWINKNTTIEEFEDNEIELLDELHNLISANDAQKGISYRIAEKISSYLSNLPVNETEEYLLDRKEAFDIQIKQRVLTKLKGTERQYSKLLGKISVKSGDIVESQLNELFESELAKSVSDFELTKLEIRRKAKELSIYGYAN